MNDSRPGRFELIESTHWSLSEMSDAFGYDYETFLRLGGYPARRVSRTTCRDGGSTCSIPLWRPPSGKDVPRWRRFAKAGADEGAVPRSQYSAQEISYRKLLGQLDDRATPLPSPTTSIFSPTRASSPGCRSMPQGAGASAAARLGFVHDTALMVSDSWRRHGVALLRARLARGISESAVGAWPAARSVREGSGGTGGARDARGSKKGDQPGG